MGTTLDTTSLGTLYESQESMKIEKENDGEAIAWKLPN